jgi:hypothetical protein
MRKLITLAAALAATLVVAIAPAGAVTDGELDGNAHPYVGWSPSTTAKASTCGVARQRSCRQLCSSQRVIARKIRQCRPRSGSNPARLRQGTIR